MAIPPVLMKGYMNYEFGFVASTKGFLVLVATVTVSLLSPDGTKLKTHSHPALQICKLYLIYITSWKNINTQFVIPSQILVKIPMKGP